ncbi:hypothetical protein E0L93_03705 [Rubrobacter taiwanensis]|jgi:chromosome segregation ATPase|uniref:Helix-turn-helix domain-containing protein n=1 Tax=Rubrobacter taiwanensis TaxID=185139 RepID=A0A4R1BQT1_9ACTN|nr:hypothetical protein [Rubrobacter taiwanensis]TCJ20060.1 hypothetical protein E0L93_03705 [Rubrobacter taiwanensis]
MAEERIGLERAAEILGRSPDEVLSLVEKGRLAAHEPPQGERFGFKISEVEELARSLEEEVDDEEIFEGEVMGEESESRSGLPAVPFERYERLLQQGQDYKTRLEERTRRLEEVQQERDAARMEIDRLWSEIERLNLVEFQRELQEKTISTLEEEKARLEREREALIEERVRLLEEKAELAEERARLEAEIKALKNRGFWSRLFGG